jgi:hypothetical protein
MGKKVIAVEDSNLPESYYWIKTEDGESFHICGTDLGSWIVDGPMSDGAFKDFTSLAAAVDNHFYQHRKDNYDLESRVRVTAQEGALVVNLEGVLPALDFKLSIEAIADPWEKKVWSHPEATRLLKEALPMGEFWKMLFQNSEEVPPELLLPRC